MRKTLVFLIMCVTVFNTVAFENKRILFRTTGTTGGFAYRIPSIAKAKNGMLIAISDSRPGGADVGRGKVDLVYRISSDNGMTWSNEIPLSEKYSSDDPSNDYYGYGDAAMVADSRSNEVMMMSCAARSDASCWDKRHRSVIWRSYDAGCTWSAPTDIKEKINSLFYEKNIPINNYFVGSGKVCQSRIVRVGKYYRVYAALWTTAGNGTNNYVIYSDDFGRSWNLLGSGKVVPGPGGDEPKVEELPNGNVVLSSRANFGRLINIFTYNSRPRKPNQADGEWSKEPVKGITINDGNNNTNGEIMLVKAKNIRNGQKVPLCLVSAPNKPGRNCVSVFWKILDEESDYDTPKHFIEGWTVGKQISQYHSAYSTMCLQGDGRIAFFYEDCPTGAVYDMTYIPIELKDLKGLEDYVVNP